MTEESIPHAPLKNRAEGRLDGAVLGSYGPGGVAQKSPQRDLAGPPVGGSEVAGKKNHRQILRLLENQQQMQVQLQKLGCQVTSMSCYRAREMVENVTRIA